MPWQVIPQPVPTTLFPAPIGPPKKAESGQRKLPKGLTPFNTCGTKSCSPLLMQQSRRSLCDAHLIEEKTKEDGATQLFLLLLPTQKHIPTSLCVTKKTCSLYLHGQKFA